MDILVVGTHKVDKRRHNRGTQLLPVPQSLLRTKEAESGVG